MIIVRPIIRQLFKNKNKLEKISIRYQTISKTVMKSITNNRDPFRVDLPSGVCTVNTIIVL